MHGVPEFGHALLGGLGAPKSPQHRRFREVRFQDAEAASIAWVRRHADPVPFGELAATVKRVGQGGSADTPA